MQEIETGSMQENMSIAKDHLRSAVGENVICRV